MSSALVISGSDICYNWSEKYSAIIKKKQEKFDFNHHLEMLRVVSLKPVWKCIFSSRKRGSSINAHLPGHDMGSSISITYGVTLCHIDKNMK